jgi:hypothetical protein
VDEWMDGRKKRMHGFIYVNGASGKNLPLKNAWPASFQSSQTNYTFQMSQ